MGGKKSLLIGWMLVLLIPGVCSGAAIPSFTSSKVTINFDKPKGSVDFFEAKEALALYNTGNSTVQVIGLNVSFTGSDGISASVDQTSFQISGGSSALVNVTFRANSSLTEKTYSGTLAITGTEVSSENASVSVEIVYPPATINATWAEEWGNVKAGTSFTKKLVVKEVLGYKPASNVSIAITEGGPASLSYTGYLGDFAAFENKSTEVNVSIPERSLTPGSYPLKIVISSPTNITSGYENISYVIPTPQMVLSNTTVDLGRVTFEPGKEASEGLLIIQEIGGYTPIEGLKITLTSGEIGWITYPDVDYVAPGSTVKIPLNVFLPQDGTLGEKAWVYKLTTDYAGSRDLNARVLVYFPGIEEALRYLEEVKPPEGYPKSNDIIKSTSALLERTKGVTDTRKIVSVMSIYSGTRTFLSEISEAVRQREGGRIDVAGDSVIRGHRSLLKMKVGEENLGDKALTELSGVGTSAADIVWTAAAQDVLNDLENEAGKNKASNYKYAVLYYKRISQIYGLMGRGDKEKEFLDSQSQMEGLYRDALTEASRSRAEADADYEEAMGRTINFRGGSFIINPFSFDFVSEKLSSSIAGYRAAEEKYSIAGERKEATLLREKAAEIEGKRASIVKSFTVLGILLAVLFVGFLVRVSLALQRFRIDEADILLGDIVMKPKGQEGPS